MEPAAAVADAFLELAEPMPDVPVELAHQLAVAPRQLDSDASRLAWVLASLAHLIGLLTLELGGHFVGTAEPADALWYWTVSAQQKHAR